MPKASAYVGFALLAFCAGSVSSHALFAPELYNLEYRKLAPATAANGPEVKTRPMMPRQLDPDSQLAQWMNPKTNYTAFNVSEECILWDDTCKGDREKALNIFFNQTLNGLLQDKCFTAPGPLDSNQCTGTASVPTASSLLWSTLKSWMREPACTSSALEYRSASRTCCGSCSVGGPNVDVYYWPSPNANTSCLSIIGTVINQPTEGATTGDPFGTYWGYTTMGGNTNSPHVITIPTVLYTSINGQYFKMPVSNPWESISGASPTTSYPGISNAPLTTLLDGNSVPSSKIQARANLVAIPNQRRAPINESNGIFVSNNSSPGSTVVYNGHTFTSPSIYVDFYSLSATDFCGYLGPIIKSTLVAFAPGELSTIATPLDFGIGGALGSIPSATSVYNFDDLPCPPMSVMWDQWYKPAPGEPYRPLLAFPSKLTGLDPLWKNCNQGYFTGYDPPRTLDHAAAMAPKVTPPLTPNPDPAAAKPAATQENLPKKTTTPADPANTPSNLSSMQDPGSSGVHGDSSQKANVPDDTKKAPLDPSSNNEGSSGQQRDSSQKANVPEDTKKAPLDPSPQNQGSSGVKGDPSQKANVEGPSSSDPKTNPENPALPDTPVNSDPHQQGSHVHANQGAPVGDGETTPQSLSLAPTTPVVKTIVLGGHSVLASVGGVNVDGVNVKPGASTTGASGQLISIDRSNNLYFDGQTTHIDPTLSPPIITIANQLITPMSKGVVIQGTTLEREGSPATIAGTAFSLDASNNVFVNDHSYHLPQVTHGAPLPTTVNGEAIMPLATGISIHHTSLTPGAPPLVISGTPYSLDASNNIFVNDHSYHLPQVTPQPTIVNGEAIMPLATGISIHHTSLTPGAPPLVISGTPYSLDASNNLHYGGSSFALPVMTAALAAGQTTTIAGERVVGLATGISIAGTTLTAGASVVAGPSGVPISLGSSYLVVGSATIPLETASPSGALAGSISSGLSGQGPGHGSGVNTTENNGSAVAFTGGSNGRKLDFGWILRMLIVIWSAVVAVR